VKNLGGKTQTAVAAPGAIGLREHVEQTILARRLFGRGAAVLVAVSGGMDSVVLLHLLHSLADTHHWRLVVAHFNHQLRGRSSDADARLAQRTAEKLGLDFVLGRGDVRDHAGKNKLSLEMAARQLRHDFLAQTARAHRITHIALAHHADDQVELFFLRLLRGAGGEALAGMKWQSASPADARIRLARPLLDQPKSALAEYAKAGRVPFREDASNASLDIQRNRIRHELLPLLTANYQPALARVVLRQMEIVGAEAELVTETARKCLKQRREFAALPAALQRRCLQLQLAEAGVAPNFDLVEQLRIFADRAVNVGGNTSVSRDSDGCLSVQETGKSGFRSEAMAVRLKGRAGEIAFEEARISWKIELRQSGTLHAPLRRVNCECFDAGKVGRDIVLRHWLPGDRFQPIGMASPVKLQDLFTNQKIARAKRLGLMVGAVAAGDVFWVEGLRMGERFKLDKNTRYELIWRWKRL
jgi:tRNA(Ile)-lysidine synthase